MTIDGNTLYGHGLIAADHISKKRDTTFFYTVVRKLQLVKII